MFLPDRFLGGIVGAFLAAIAGAVVFGFLLAGLTVPGQSDTGLEQALIAVPGSIDRARALLRAGERREREAAT